MKKYFAILAFFILAGCYSTGTVQKSSMIKSAGNQALINFVVIQDLAADQALAQLFGPINTAIIKINGKKIAAIKGKDLAQTKVSPGKHKISTRWSGNFINTHATINFEAGKIYYFGIGEGAVTNKIEYGARAGIKKLTKEEWANYSSR